MSNKSSHQQQLNNVDWQSGEILIVCAWFLWKKAINSLKTSPTAAISSREDSEEWEENCWTHLRVTTTRNWRSSLMKSQERFDFCEIEFSFFTLLQSTTTREMNHSSNGFWNLPALLKKPHLKTIKRYDLMWCGLWVILDEEFFSSVYELIYRGAICFSFCAVLFKSIS